MALLAAENVLAHALAHAATLAPLALTSMLWIAGLAVGAGLERDAAHAIEAGADVRLSARALGGPAPLDLQWLERASAADGVVDRAARIIGTAYVGPQAVRVVGLEGRRFDSLRREQRASPDDDGASSASALASAGLGATLGLKPGSRVALEGARTLVFRVEAVLDAREALVAQDALVVDFARAQELFGDARATDGLIWTRPGYAEGIARAAERLAPGLVATTKQEQLAELSLAQRGRAGAMSLWFAAVTLLSIAAFAVHGYFTGARRAREIAIYKLCGFSGGDVATLAVIENALLAALLTVVAAGGAMVYVRVLNAPGLAGWWFPQLPTWPTLEAPARFTPLAVGIAFVVSFSSTTSGGLLAAWALTRARAREAFR